MKLRFPDIDCDAFYRSIINSSRESENVGDAGESQRKRNRLNSLYNNGVSRRHQKYEECYRSNTLHSINVNSGLSADDADLLKNMYYPQRSPIIKLRNAICQTNNDFTCPYCEFGEVSSLDHYLPKSTFPEFSVYPKNLIPCCQVCNQNKGKDWEYGRKTNLNPYLDDINISDFIHAEFKLEDGKIAVLYEMKNKILVSQELFDIIQEHFSSMKLAERYAACMTSKVYKMLKDLKTAYSSHTFDEELQKLRFSLTSNVTERKLDMQILLSLLENEELLKEICSNETFAFSW